MLVKEGWVNQEGKKGEPRLQYMAIQYLQDVLTTFAKKLIIQFNVVDLQEQLITSLHQLFRSNSGDNTVTFEVMELNKIKKQIEIAETVMVSEPLDDENGEFEQEVPQTVVTDIEDVQVVTKLSMPSRKLKVKISNELLQELERLQVNFKLN